MTTTKATRRSREKAGVRPWIVIQMALACRGKTMADVAREVRVTRSAVAQVARGKRSAKIEDALAKACGVPADELFGR